MAAFAPPITSQQVQRAWFLMGPPTFMSLHAVAEQLHVIRGDLDLALWRRRRLVADA